ncbi:PadR family transcriptional regulator [Evansella cellulosilytica]|uniref:Transcriptional regulator, PadR-like family n=1 Tax=Evansella cellulosilytica (strain ATCC 21833 / DSM 2522 / FERM P-1141 / JCM 9156 / N-4) TaxID=649639 RepID=E6TVD2_EVAC2|nr:PadR family transcriptional regulator [Evansella cellulosilytica]ADU30949.1 transcriptional regulator, PadR-like family [Evansella cellulosilytica DSM 2522]
MDIKHDQWIVQLKKGVYELAILLLIRKKAMYGYELTQRLNQVPLFTLAEGSIYPILKRMVTKQWIESYWQESADGPRRKYYEITEEGKVVVELRMNDYKELYKALEHLKEGNDVKDN